jgi:Tol biopolymer transport system component
MFRRLSLLALASACLASVLAGCGGSAKPRPDLVFVSTRSGVYAVYAMNNDGGRQRRLTEKVPTAASSPANLFFQVDPAWSPDAKQIAFASTRGGTSAIYAMNADGSGTKLLGSVPGGAVHPSWSPDGKQIVFGGANHKGLYVMDADGSRVHRIGRDSAKVADPAWSPDGKLIAFVRTEPNTPITELWVIQSDGKGLRRVTSLASTVASPSWAPFAKGLAFAAPVRGQYEIYTVRTDGTGLKRLTASAAEDIDPAWSPDGNLIAFSRDGAIDTVEPTTFTVHSLTNGKDNDSSPAWKPGASSTPAAG